jgi:hypothetical protein
LNGRPLCNWSTGLEQINPFFLEVPAQQQEFCGKLLELESPHRFENIRGGLAPHSLPCLLHVTSVATLTFHGLLVLLSQLSIESLMCVWQVRVQSLVDFFSAKMRIENIWDASADARVNFSRTSQH